MILVDTSYLLALTNPRDLLHARAQEWAKAITEPLLVTQYILWEVVNAYSMPADRAKAHAIVARCRNGSDCEYLPAAPDVFEAGLRLHAARSDKEWSLTDCISIHVMQERDITRCLSHDHHFEQAGFQSLLRRAP